MKFAALQLNPCHALAAMINAFDMHTYDPNAHKYAIAIIDLASSSKLGSLSRLQKDFASIARLVKTSTCLQKLLRAPLVAKKDKASVFAEISKKAGFCDLTSQFLQVLALRGRSKLLGDILATFDSEVSKIKGDVVAKVQSAEKLSAKQSKEIAQQIKDYALADGGGKVSIENIVDPDILGGLIITVGSTRIDDSLSNKLTRLKTKMRSNKLAA